MAQEEKLREIGVFFLSSSSKLPAYLSLSPGDKFRDGGGGGGGGKVRIW